MDDVYQKRLTDHDLTVMLRRVNAREVAKYIDLQGCTKIQGSGLAPIRNSLVFESLNMEGTDIESNPVPVLWILRSVIPHKFFVLLLSADCISYPSDALLDFMRYLRLAKLEQAQEQRIKCSCCQLPVMEESRQIVPNVVGALSVQCYVCDEYFCRRGSCPMDVKECCECKDVCCMDCELAKVQCHSCGNSYCKPCCGGLLHCVECDKYCCDDCKGVEECSHCDDGLWCKDCAKTLPLMCVNGFRLCKGCWESGRCNECSEFACVACFVPRKCGGCSKKYCTKPSCDANLRRCGDDDELCCLECDEDCSGGTQKSTKRRKVS